MVPVLPPPGTLGTDLPVRSALPALADALAARGSAVLVAPPGTGKTTLVPLALTLTPGLDTALVLRAALTRGRRDAAPTAAGIVTGLFVWGAAAAVGISALLTASQVAYDVLRFAGAAYLVWFGLRLLVRAVRATPGAEPSGVADSSPWRAARQGLTTNLLNPKVGVFYVALLPQFLPAGGDPLAVGPLLPASTRRSRCPGSVR